MSEVRLITSALPYINNAPHLGTLVGCLLPADIFARYSRLRGYKTLFISGTDEYGTPSEVAAMKLGITPKELCDFFFKVHKEVYDWIGISCDNFSRTSIELHKKVVQEMFLDIFRNGYILEQEQELPYDPKAQRFLPDRFVEGECPYCGKTARGDQCENCCRFLDPKELKNLRSAITGEKVVFKKTRHLFIDLRRLEPKLKEWLSTKEGFWKKGCISLALGWIKEGLKPRSITRDLTWGVPVPYEEMWKVTLEKIKNKLDTSSKEKFIESLIRELKNLNLVVPEEEIEKFKGIVDEHWPDIDKIFKEYNYFEIYKNKVFYVWFDAPIGYLTFTIEKTENWREFWCEDSKIYHFIGKDNIPFHTIFWPGMILAFNDKAINFVKVLNEKPEVQSLEGVKIEEIEPKDYGEIHKLSKEFVKEVPGSSEDAPDFIEKCEIKLKAVKDDKIVGYILGKYHEDFKDGWLVVESIYVSPEYRNKGIGKLLVKAFESKAFENGYRKIFVPAVTKQSYYLFKNLGYEFDEDRLLNCWLNLPYNVVGLQFINYEGSKFSKSRGWGVFCENLPKYGIHPDYWRFALSLLLPENRDSDFTWKLFEEFVNKELIGNVVNLAYRVLSFTYNRFGGDLTDTKPKEEILDYIKKYKQEIEDLFEKVELVSALKKILEFSALGNKLFQEAEPWKNPDKEFLKAMLYYVKALAILISPYIPSTAEKILRTLNYKENFSWEDSINFEDLGKINKPEPFLRKLSKEDIELLKEKTTKPTDFERIIKNSRKPKQNSVIQR